MCFYGIIIYIRMCKYARQGLAWGFHYFIINLEIHKKYFSVNYPNIS